MQRILVTGAASWVGGNLIGDLESRGDVEVFAMDEIPPTIPFRSNFSLSSFDTLELAEHVIGIAPTTVVHLQTLHRSPSRGPESPSDVILGLQALFGAIARLPSVRTVIVRSDTAVYGSGSRNPSVVTEATVTSARLTRYEANLREVESSVDQLAAEMPGITFTVLRFGSILGAHIGNPLSRFLRLPIVPTLLGCDPRLQFLHESDAVGVLRHAVDHPVAGTFNIAADGQLYMSRILRLGRRCNQRLPRRQFRYAMAALQPIGASLPEHLVNVIRYGRVTDTKRMHEEMGFQPRLDCRQTVLTTYERIRE